MLRVQKSYRLLQNSKSCYLVKSCWFPFILFRYLKKHVFALYENKNTFNNNDVKQLWCYCRFVKRLHRHVCSWIVGFEDKGPHFFLQECDEKLWDWNGEYFLKKVYFENWTFLRFFCCWFFLSLSFTGGTRLLSTIWRQDSSWVCLGKVQKVWSTSWRD